MQYGTRIRIRKTGFESDRYHGQTGTYRAACKAGTGPWHQVELDNPPPNSPRTILVHFESMEEYTDPLIAAGTFAYADGLSSD